MRSEDEDEEEDFEEENDENEEDEDEGYGQQPNGGPDGGDDEAMGYFDEDASGEENDEDDAEGDVDVDADGDGDEGEGDDDEDDDESGDGEGDADEDEDEDDDGDGDEDDEEDGHSEDEDVEMADGDQGSASSHPSQRTAGKAVDLPLPPHLVRRSLFTPAFTTPPSTLTIEAIVAIPLPTAIHSIAASACSSYLLTGGQDGYIRAYDFWASVNGSQLMTAQQRTSVGLGEGVNKAGVGRGWWPNEVEGMNGGTVSQRREAVYSMAVEGDALWSLSGTQSGPINLYTLRHSPGHLVHTLKGHSNVVSCMSLLPNEKGLLSGSWDGTVKEWDLNTGQTVRTYPTHGAQISSLSLRPFSHPVSPTPSPQPIDEDEDKGTKLDVSVNVGSDFFQKDRKDGSAVSPAKDSSAMEIDGNTDSKGEGQGTKPIPEGTDADADGSDKASPFDPLFDDDAEGESVLPSGEVTMTGTPAINDMAPPSPPRPAPSLVLPGMTTNGNTPVANAAQTSSVPSTPLFSIPSQAGPSRLGAASTIPLLSPASWKTYSEDVMLNSSMDGQVLLIDRRIPDNGSNTGVGRLKPGDKAPPWCMSATWSGDGNQVLAGRRNGTIDVWDIRRSSSSTAPNLLRVLRTPTESGPVSCIVSMPDGRHVATASQDNIRLWNTYEYFHDDKLAAGGEGMKKRGGLPPFKIIAGHHGGIVSSMLVDPTGRFLVAASGDRGWQGESTKVVLVHEIKW